MNVVVCSCFRNSSAYLNRYFAQMDALDRLLTLRGDCLSLVLGYGDSTDETDALLFEHTSGGIGARLIDVTHGGKEFGSVVDAQRFKQLAGIGNKLFANVPTDADAVLVVESDLIWQADALLSLIDGLADYPCVAPMIMEISSQGFYDCWAFRKNGVRFQKQAPYFDGWPTSEMTKLDSAGSVLAMNAELARHLTWPEESVIVGICEQINQLGGSVYLDPALTVFHS